MQNELLSFPVQMFKIIKFSIPRSQPKWSKLQFIYQNGQFNFEYIGSHFNHVHFFKYNYYSESIITVHVSSIVTETAEGNFQLNEMLMTSARDFLAKQLGVYFWLETSQHAMSTRWYGWANCTGTRHNCDRLCYFVIW